MALMEKIHRLNFQTFLQFGVKNAAIQGISKFLLIKR